MNIHSGLFYRGALVANLLVAFTIASTIDVHAEGRRNGVRNYSSNCSFYGQNQAQAESIGCSIEHGSSRIVISWDDGFTTTLNAQRNGNWLSMPSESRAEVRFYTGTGQVAHVEIYEGPGQGIIVVDP
ncbi:hypothetical protein [Laspinema palackyanum]|uniref:hypothetical protein n=1 Tax=Laspinema palackyanum TaxID=3231601 RepID=UPI00345D4439|nr:hypothetical protein [Laspinema sp. D2c]